MLFFQQLCVKIIEILSAFFQKVQVKSSEQLTRKSNKAFVLVFQLFLYEVSGKKKVCNAMFPLLQLSFCSKKFKKFRLLVFFLAILSNINRECLKRKSVNTFKSVLLIKNRIKQKKWFDF